MRNGGTMSDAAITSVVIAGVGGQGIVTAADILAGAVYRQGLDVKKSEIHGMSQRGGSVCSDIRFGPRVLSPMVPVGTADYLVVLEPTQVGPNRHILSKDGVLITPDDAAYILEGGDNEAPNPWMEKLVNVALLGVLSAYLTVPESCWLDSLRDTLPERLHDMNIKAFIRARTVETIARLVANESKPNRR